MMLAVFRRKRKQVGCFETLCMIEKKLLGNQAKIAERFSILKKFRKRRGGNSDKHVVKGVNQGSVEDDSSSVSVNND